MSDSAREFTQDEVLFFDNITCSQCGQDFRQWACGIAHGLVKVNPRNHNQWNGFFAGLNAKRTEQA